MIMSMSMSTATQQQIETIKVAAKSRTRSVAGAIAGSIREHNGVHVQAIGPYAVNQAVKAIALARRFLEEEGAALTCQPGFADIEVEEDRTVTAMRFTVSKV